MTEPNPDTRLISGSEVSAWQGCQMRWWFSFRLGVQPIKLSDGLFVGTMGHEALSTYYSLIRDGVHWSDAVESLTDFVVREMDKNQKLRKTGFISPQMASERQVLISKLAGILDNYAEHYAEKDFNRYRVVEVEHLHVERFFAMRLDLLLRDNNTGALVLMDHKFIRDFYGPKQLTMNAQLPRYMRVVIGDREEQVSHGILNMLRTRDVKSNEKRFERAQLPYNEVVAAKRCTDQEEIAEYDIRPQYRRTPRESMDSVKRTLSDYTCKFCPFTEPCVLGLEGRIEEMKDELDNNFERSTYGYNK